MQSSLELNEFNILSQCIGGLNSHANERMSTYIDFIGKKVPLTFYRVFDRFRWGGHGTDEWRETIIGDIHINQTSITSSKKN